MSKLSQVSAIAIMLMAVLAVSGCLCCPGGAGNILNNGAGSQSGSPTVTPVPIQPKMAGDLYDMTYLWNNVNYCRLAYDVPDSDEPGDGVSGTYTLEFHDKTYNGTPAREVIFNTTDNTGGLNISMDIFFKKSADGANLTFLGGRMRITNVFTDDGPPEIELPITPEMVEAEASGDFNAMNREATGQGFDHYDANETPGTDPNVDRDHKGMDLNTFVRLESSMMDYMPLTRVGTETLTLGGKSYVCTVYNGTFNETTAREALLHDKTMGYELAAMGGEGLADNVDVNMAGTTKDLEKMTMTFWYCPEFPAMPLKCIYNVRSKAPYTFTVEDIR